LACKPPELFGGDMLSSERPLIDGKLALVACLGGQRMLKHRPFRSHLTTKSGQKLIERFQALLAASSRFDKKRRSGSEQGRFNAWR
jgi:hypothetical protein